VKGSFHDKKQNNKNRKRFMKNELFNPFRNTKNATC